MNEREPKRDSKSLRVNLNIFWFIIIILSTILLTTIITTLSVDGRTERAVNVGTDTRQEFAKLYNVYDTLTKEYYTDVDKDKLIESSIKGMVDGLDDPYSEYMKSDETEDFEQSITGDFEGIGTEIMEENNTIVVSSPMKGSPAEKAGIQPGDKILAIDGESIKGNSTRETSEMIRGEKGTDVTLKIERGNDKPFNVTITRDTIHIDSVTYENKDDIAHISINRFQKETSNELKKYIEQAENEEVKDVIIDFRSNPGGLLNEAVSMINLFIEKGTTLLYLEDKNENREEIVAEEDRLVDLNKTFDNVYILVNEGSASASEVFAGAMQDLTDVEIVGTKTFGKGIVQRTSEFKDNSLVKYTNTKWLTPNGDWIHEKGIEPEFEINNPDYYRVKFLDSEEAYIEGQENEDIISIKVILDTLGYDIKTFDNKFDDNLTKAVYKYQKDNKLTEDGVVSGKTTEQMMSDIRKHINNHDEQLDYLKEYIKGDKTKKEITKEMKENSKHIPVDESRKPDDSEQEEDE